jgi:hypothetical protein
LSLTRDKDARLLFKCINVLDSTKLCFIFYKSSHANVNYGDDKCI